MLMKAALCGAIFLTGGVAGCAISIGGDTGFILAIICAFIGGVIAAKLTWEKDS